MKKHFFLSIFLILLLNISFAQRGKDGAKIVTTTAIVNDFTTLTSDAFIGNFFINVANSNLNTNFIGTLSPGDLIMIIQVQGISIEDSIGIPFSNSSKFYSSWGRITNYNNCGNYEFLQVESVPNSITINFDCGLQHNYTSSGKVIVVRVPRYSSLTINNGGKLTTSQWNGTSGGILAVEVDSITTINTGGSINVSGLGFRGGLNFNASSVFGGLRFADSNANEGAEKGEGIAGDQAFYTTLNLGGAKQCRGAAANAGGGGNAHNGGGGGGANAGNLANWNDGVGVPDPSYNTAWALESPSIAGLNSSGGGRGGYSFFNTNNNELTVSPGNGSWGGDNRNQVGGLGGRPLDYSTGKIFMGGAGGAGEGNDGEAGDGGNGGGIIFLNSYGNITGSGQILANGADGGDVIGANVFGQLNGKDAGGGAGAGGTIILKTTGTVSLTGSINANGGVGGDQVLVAGTFASINEGEGPGGGGGGGYIAISSGTPTRNANGGISGTTNCPYVSNFPPNGATGGGIGLPNETINSFDITVSNSTICSNTTDTLTATLTGTPPAGTTIEWYDAQFGGTLLFTGASFITPVLSTTTTYWVKACPAPYLIPVTVTVTPCSTIAASFSATDSTLCVGDCINFSDLTSGAPTAWTWYFFGASTTSSSTQNPVGICYNAIGSFGVSLVVTDGASTDSLYIPNFITVNSLPLVTANATKISICIGDTVTLTGGGATSYTWDNSVNDGVAFTPTTTTLYTVTGTDGNSCQNTDTITVFVNPLPTVTANATSTSICTGNAVTLTGGGATSYTWNNSVSDGVAFTPSTTTLYTVTGTDGNSCQNTDTITVFVQPLPNVTANATSTSVCTGDSVTLTGGGATSYSWDNGVSDGVAFIPSTTTLYAVTGTDGNSCQNTDTITVFVNPLPTVTANATSTSICTGNTVTLTGGGATSYTWDNSIFDGIAFTPSTTTLYTVTGTDGNSCQNTDTITVFVQPLPNITANATSTSVCTGDSVTLTGGGATSYSWDNGVTDGVSFIPTSTTLYTVTGTDGNGCQNTATITVVVSTCGVPPVVSFSASDSTLCIGDCINFNDLSTAAPTGWTWYFFGASTTSSSVQNPTNICYNTAGSFDVALVDTNATGQDSLFMPNFITVNALPNIVTSNDTTICTGDTANISVAGANSYIWDNGLGVGSNQTPFPIISTTYHVTGTDINGCVNTDSVMVTVNACGTPPVVSFSASDSTICVGDCISFTDLSSNVPTGWTWYFFGAATTNSSIQNPTTICYNTAGSFDVALVDTNATGQDSLFMPNFITVNALPTVVASLSNDTICLGDSVILIASGADTYQWFDNLGQSQNDTIFPTQSGVYIVQGIDTNGCSNSDNVAVQVSPCIAPVSNFSSITAACINDCIDFTDLSLNIPTNWTWYFFGGNPSNSNIQNPTNICYDSTGLYSVALVTSNLFGQDSIYMSNYITIDSCNIVSTDFIIPTVFSPNGDGQNDLFSVTGSGINSINISIYNRWGSLIFKSEQLGKGWDGRTTAGVICTEGTYFYIIKIDSEIHKGTITILR